MIYLEEKTLQLSYKDFYNNISVLKIMQIPQQAQVCSEDQLKFNNETNCWSDPALIIH